MLKAQNLCYSQVDPFTKRTTIVLRGLDLSVRPGERVALMGSNGAGKSTLLRILSAAVPPSAGSLEVDGRILSWADPTSVLFARQKVGFVGQDPDDQMVASTVFDEVAFGPCNLGLPEGEVRQRVSEALRTCQLEGLEGRLVHELSGGQRQRVVLAGIMAMRPRYVLLDEPCSMLDAASRHDMLAAIQRMSAQGCGVVHVTHSLDEVLDYDRVVVLREGSLMQPGTPIDLLLNDTERELACCLCSEWLEVARELVREGHLSASDAFNDPSACASALSEAGLKRASELLGERGASPVALREGQAGICARGVSLAYPGGIQALQSVDFDARPAELTLVVGATGSGKSTLLHVLAGLVAPDAGSVSVDGTCASPASCACSFQRAQEQLFADSVLKDVAFGPRNLGCSAAMAEERAKRALARVGLAAEEVAPRNPFSLSGGQMRRVALAGVLACETPFVALDEPTVGLDAPGVDALRSVLADLLARGIGVVAVTHDPGALIDYATRLVFVAEGRVVAASLACDLFFDCASWQRAHLLSPAITRFAQGVALRLGASEAAL